MTIFESLIALVLPARIPKKQQYQDMFATISASADDLKRQAEEFANCDCVSKVRRIMTHQTKEP